MRMRWQSRESAQAEGSDRLFNVCSLSLLSVCISLCLSLSASLCLSLCVCLSVCRSLCLCLSVCLFVCCLQGRNWRRYRTSAWCCTTIVRFWLTTWRRSSPPTSSNTATAWWVWFPTLHSNRVSLPLSCQALRACYCARVCACVRVCARACDRRTLFFFFRSVLLCASVCFTCALRWSVCLQR